MMEEIFKNRVGRTPLIRAYNLEKELGISKIHLKLEGNNPSGHREDRLAYLIIRDAITRGKKTICMGTYGTIGGSLSYLSKYFDVSCVFYVPNKKKISRKDLFATENVKIIEYGKNYSDCVIESRRVSNENGWYDANFGFANSMMNMYAFSYVANEINRQLDGKIDSVFCQTFNGSSISGLHLGFKELWINGDLDVLPRIWAVSTENGNAIIESFKSGSKKLMKLDPKEVRKTRYSRHMVNWDCQNGQDALNAISDTYGRAIGVTDEEIVEYGRKFKKLEKIKITLPNSYPIAAFMKAANNGDISNGNHVIVLDDGKIDLDIELISKDDLNISYGQFLDKLDEWLLEFSDPMDEIAEAVENGFEHGHVIGAFDHGAIVGIAILSRTNFDTFLPKYHLSYIATKKDVKGKGIATQLLQKAIDVSKGDLSLHVETDNKKAIKLYEKMGLRKKYYRMLYVGEEYDGGK
ncbi:MAG: pyridoxal-phosphate dependent enzyme [Candidatus Thermoplasmatota archaeon]|nr:pyridoxal-phosphate dependent enzyme [Candidatus Thermoplasmatota archaeon]